MSEIKEWQQKLVLAQIDRDYHKQNMKYQELLIKRYRKHIKYLEGEK